MKKNYGKAILSVTMVIALAVLSTSCGTKLPEAGDYTEADSASGSAVDSVQNEMGAEKKESICDRLPFCNDEHYYTFDDDDGTLFQYGLRYPLSESPPGTYYVKNGKGVTIWYVNNKEIFYVAKKKELWRIPIKKDKYGICPQVNKAEKVLSEKNEIVEVYADDNYILYLSKEPATGDDKYNEYDRKAGQKVSIGTEFATIFSGHLLSQVIERGYILLACDCVRLDKKYPMFYNGIYIHKIGSGKVTKIDDGYFSTSFTDDDKVVRPLVGAKAADGKFYYFGRYSGTEKAEVYPLEEQDIWVYDIQTGKREKFVSEEQFTQSAIKNKVGGTGNFFTLNSIHIDRGKMYIYTYFYGGFALFSKELTEGSELKYEKGSSQFLTSGEKKTEDVYAMNIVEGKLLFGYGKDNFKVKCYDLAKGTEKDVKIDDAEVLYLCALGVGSLNMNGKKALGGAK